MLLCANLAFLKKTTYLYKNKQDKIKHPIWQISEANISKTSWKTRRN